MAPVDITCNRTGLPAPRGRSIGLYGGSFNPAHIGHLKVSRAAIHAMGLDQVWWLVTPGNPLKEAPGAGLMDRIANAQALIKKDPCIVVTGAEMILHTRFTVDTIKALRRLFPKVNFVWIMGADNLIQFPQWQCWQEIAHRIPIAVFSRPTYSYKALSGRAAWLMALWQVNRHQTRRLSQIRPPAWGFFWLTSDQMSSTVLRQADKTVIET